MHWLHLHTELCIGRINLPKHCPCLSVIKAFIDALSCITNKKWMVDQELQLHDSAKDPPAHPQILSLKQLSGNTRIEEASIQAALEFCRGNKHIEDLLWWQESRVQLVGSPQNEVLCHLRDGRQCLLTQL